VSKRMLKKGVSKGNAFETSFFHFSISLCTSRMYKISVLCFVGTGHPIFSKSRNPVSGTDKNQVV
jgi:hypothetical protein